MKQDSNIEMTLLVFGVNLGIYENIEPSEDLTVSGKSFRRHDKEDTHGFYDWLRDKPESIIGIRIFLFEDYQSLVSHFRHLQYVRLDETKHGNFLISVFFRPDRNFKDRLSEDQSFTGNYIYRSDDGEIAMTFERPSQSKIVTNDPDDAQ